MPRRKSKIKEKIKMNVRIITYNVLSSHLRDPKRFTKCTTKALDPNGSYRKLIKRLDSEISDLSGAASKPVFCLQEVSRLWAGNLTAWFNARNYTFIPSLYGREFNGYMGCAIAVPMDAFSITDCKIDRLSETKKFWPVDPAEEFAYKNRFKKKKSSSKKNDSDDKGWWATFCELFSSSSSTEKNNDNNNNGSKTVEEEEIPKPHEEKIAEYWHKAKYRHNTVIAVQLSTSKGGKFWIGNYHMPCAFWSPPLMSIHTALLGQYMETLSKNDKIPFVLAGDFNFSPEKAQYEIMVNGKLSALSTDAMPVFPSWWDSNWKPTLKCGLRSAYKEHFGEEPDCTNYAFIDPGPDPFIDTLDYIFLSKNINVLDARELPNRLDINGPMPNKKFESDHLLLCSDLEITSSL